MTHILRFLSSLAAGYRHERTSSLGKRFGIFALFAISLLCIAREAFLCATESNQAKVRSALPAPCTAAHIVSVAK